MPRLELPDKFCRGVEMPNGGPRFRSDQPGSAIVNNELAKHFANEGFFVSHGAKGFSGATASSITCPDCGHERWAWVDECRCRVSGIDPKAA